MATSSLPDIPYKSQVVDQAGYLTPAWAGFFRTLFQRLGGNTAPTINDFTARMNALQVEITTNADNISDITNSIAGLSDFGLGRSL